MPKMPTRRVKPTRGPNSKPMKPHGKDPHDKYRALDMLPAEQANANKSVNKTV